MHLTSTSAGWNPRPRSPRNLCTICTHRGDRSVPGVAEMDAPAATRNAIAAADVVLIALPLTPAFRDLLNAGMLAWT
jgi:lactate dehydrogenase-like 2-hydroxyacid dehydrogenase